MKTVMIVTLMMFLGATQANADNCGVACKNGVTLHANTWHCSGAIASCNKNGGGAVWSCHYNGAKTPKNVPIVFVQNFSKGYGRWLVGKCRNF